MALLILERLYKKLCDLKLEKVSAYFNGNWHNIRDEWTIFGRNAHANYTNNRTERLNRTLKQIGSRYAGLLTFFDNLTTSVSVLSSEKDIKAIKSTMRVERINFDHPCLERYREI